MSDDQIHIFLLFAALVVLVVILATRSTGG